MRPRSDAGRDTRPSVMHKERGHKHPKLTKRLRKAAWAGAAAVLVAVITNSLTGVISTGIRAVTERVTDGEPLIVHPELVSSTCGGWVVPGRKPTPHPSRLPADIQSDESLRAWLRSTNAVDLGVTTVELTIRGRSGTAVVLQGIRVKVVGPRRKPIVGAEVTNGCGSALPLRLYQADLDAAQPVAKPVDNHVVPFPYRVTHGDPEVILVSAETRACDCSWVLELVYVDGDQEKVKVIDNHGKPFRTTGSAKKPPSKKGN